MELSEENLKMLIDYSNDCSADIRDFTKGIDYSNIFKELDHCEQFDISAAPLHYGSGTASFVDIFCTKRESESLLENSDAYMSVKGITLYLCTIAPLATWGYRERKIRFTHPYSNLTKRGFHEPLMTFLTPSEILSTPDASWENVVKGLSEIVTGHGIQILKKEELNKPLWFDTEIDTLIGDETNYLVFDAVFFWSD